MNERGFAADNQAGAHPEVLEALAAANAGHAPSYGADPWTARAHDAIRAHLGDHAEPFLVFNGTAANVLALRACCRSWEAVICAQSAHLHVDECAAPEVVGHVKLLTVPAPHGKLTPELVTPLLVRAGDEHAVQPRVVSIAQSTELGTVYTVQEISALAALCRERGLLLHMDGARVFNGAVARGASLREMVTDAGVDVLSLGGTKIGLLGAEATVFLRPELARDVRYLRKQSMQLASKQRFLAAQVEVLLTTGLWERAARHANAMAARLAAAVRDVPGVTITNEVTANAVFAVLDAPVTERLQRDWHFYVWDETTGEVRWMTSWDTTEDDVDRFAAAIRDAVVAAAAR
jgi:threonine aldolase